MSTWHYLECASHTPPLRWEDEVEQHAGTSLLSAICAIVRDRDRIIPFLPKDDADFIDELQRERYDRYVYNAMRFLHHHPHCAVDLVTEYGDRTPLIGADS